jgi:hypothetical protein
MAVVENAWLREELSLSAFCDKRLDARNFEVISDFLRNPAAPINQAAGSATRATGAYRFFQNESCMAENILMSHEIHTGKRAALHSQVLAIQDTMTVNYGTHPATEDLGHIGSSAYHPDSRGLFVHTTYCVATDGTPLGILAQKTWSRPLVERRSRNQRKVDLRRRSVEGKESVRWLEAAKAARARVPASTNLIHVADREGDFYEFFWLAEQELGDSFIIRGKSDRCALDDDGDEVFRLSESFVDQKPICHVVVEVKGNGSRRPRLAKLAIYSRALSLKAPERAKGLTTDYADLTNIDVHVVWAVEKEVASGIKPISWLLMTNIDVTSSDVAQAVVGYYARRWRIEELHKTLKSGCKIEDCRLETFDGLKRFIAAKSTVAHRMVELTYHQRRHPNASCLEVVSELEWRCLYLRIGLPIPKTAPTLRDVTRRIAQLGGFLGRKCDGEPGIITLWRGWTIFEEDVAMVTALQRGGTEICVE